MSSTFIFQLLTFNLSAQETKITAAVMDLEAKEGISSGVVSSITDYLRTQLVNTGKFDFVTRENMDQILKEQNFQLSGCTSQECIIEVGKLMGVRKMFTGSIGKVGATYIVNIRIINVESGKIEKAETEECASCAEEALLVSIRNIANKITGAQGASQIQPEVSSEVEKEISRLMEMLKDKDINVRYKAAVALGDIGPPAKRAVPYFIAALQQDENKYVRRTSAEVLGKIGDRSALEALKLAAGNDADNDVRKAAQDAINKIDIDSKRSKVFEAKSPMKRKR